MVCLHQPFFKNISKLHAKRQEKKEKKNAQLKRMLAAKHKDARRLDEHPWCARPFLLLPENEGWGETILPDEDCKTCCHFQTHFQNTLGEISAMLLPCQMH